jgi:tetratricopeptide (TPR) repeat protein
LNWPSKLLKFQKTVLMPMSCWQKKRPGTWLKPKEYYELGVRAGERALGPKVFKNEVGYFWGLIETRPYMRARAGLADCLWLLGERQQAIKHYEDMLRLNPNDNQGIRYILVNCLLAVGADLSVEKLLNQYNDDIACSWTFSRALWIFRKEGPSHKANEALKKAVKQNPFVPLYLLGKKKMPRSLPPYVGIGDENEAIEYAAESIEVWRSIPDAFQWLALNYQTK